MMTSSQTSREKMDAQITLVLHKAMGSLIQRGGFVPALSEPMTHGCEGSKVGAIPIEEGMPQKTARKKLFMMRNGAAPDVGPPLSPGACEVRSPRRPNGHLWAPTG